MVVADLPPPFPTRRGDSRTHAFRYGPKPALPHCIICFAFALSFPLPLTQCLGDSLLPFLFKSSLQHLSPLYVSELPPARLFSFFFSSYRCFSSFLFSPFRGACRYYFPPFAQKQISQNSLICADRCPPLPLPIQSPSSDSLMLFWDFCPAEAFPRTLLLSPPNLFPECGFPLPEELAVTTCSIVFMPKTSLFLFDR